MFASPRFRRRVLRIGLVAAAVGTAVAVAVIWPNTAERVESSAPREVGSVAPARPAKQVPLRGQRRSEALATARRFIETAVAREDVAESWRLVHPVLRQGLTRRQWGSGEIPVVPYPVDAARWRLGYSTANAIGFEVLLMPRAGADVTSMMFDIELRSVESGAGQRWLVSSWAPRSAGLDQRPPQSPERAAVARRVLAEREDSVIPAGWIFLPIALLAGLLVAVPVAVLARDWRRRRIGERRHREFQAARRDGRGV